MQRFWQEQTAQRFRVTFVDGTTLNDAMVIDHDDDATFIVFSVAGADKFSGYQDLDDHEVLVPVMNISFMLPVRSKKTIDLR